MVLGVLLPGLPSYALFIYLVLIELPPCKLIPFRTPFPNWLSPLLHLNDFQPLYPPSILFLPPVFYPFYPIHHQTHALHLPYQAIPPPTSHSLDVSPTYFFILPIQTWPDWILLVYSLCVSCSECGPS